MPVAKYLCEVFRVSMGDEQRNRTRKRYYVPCNKVPDILYRVDLRENGENGVADRTAIVADHHFWGRVPDKLHALL